MMCPAYLFVDGSNLGSYRPATSRNLGLRVKVEFNV